jgi:hypothetical protein
MAIQIFRHCHPSYLDEKITWLSKNLSDAEVRSVPIDLSDARLAVARGYSFQDWERLVDWVQEVLHEGSPVAKFESAVEAVISGDVGTLERLVNENRALVQARSTVVACFDPPKHQATLLHYIAANGVENYRQKSPQNAVDVAKILLNAGAEVDALAAMYGGQWTTMSLLVSSSHPAEAGVQIELIDTLVDYGAAVNDRGVGDWTSPLRTALVFGFPSAAEALIRRGAQANRLDLAAGLGRTEDARKFLTTSSPPERHMAMALAAQLGHADIVRMLLDAGEDPDRFNPKGTHSHTTPLHQAALSGHEAVVRLLVERGARLDIKDSIYQSTPLGWAEYGGKKEIANYLRSRGESNQA